MREYPHIYNDTSYIERALAKQKRQAALRKEAEKKREIRTAKICVKVMVWTTGLLCMLIATILIAHIIATNVSEDQALLTPLLTIVILAPFMYIDKYVNNVIDKYTSGK